MLASTIISAVRFTLQDEGFATWSDAVLLADLNSAERRICLLTPDNFSIRAAIQMQQGTRQSVPVGGVAILDLYDNAIGGLRVTLVDRSLLDAATRFWPVATQETAVQHWIQDERNPAKFEVFPPNDGFGSVWGLYAGVPTPMATVGDAINVPDIYEDVLKSYVLAEAYAHNSAKQDLAKSAGYRDSGDKALGIGAQSSVAVAPKVGKPAGST